MLSHPPGTTIHACTDMQLAPKYSPWLPMPAHNFQVRKTARNRPAVPWRQLSVKLTCSEYWAFWERKNLLLSTQVRNITARLKIATSQSVNFSNSDYGRCRATHTTFFTSGNFWFCYLIFYEKKKLHWESETLILRAPYCLTRSKISKTLGR